MKKIKEENKKPKRNGNKKEMPREKQKKIDKVPYVLKEGSVYNVKKGTIIKELECHQCGSKPIVRRNSFTGKLFLGCNNFPKCRNSRHYRFNHYR